MCEHLEIYSCPWQGHEACFSARRGSANYVQTSSLTRRQCKSTERRDHVVACESLLGWAIGGATRRARPLIAIPPHVDSPPIPALQAPTDTQMHHKLLRTSSNGAATPDVILGSLLKGSPKFRGSILKFEGTSTHKETVLWASWPAQPLLRDQARCKAQSHRHRSLNPRGPNKHRLWKMTEDAAHSSDSAETLPQRGAVT